MSSVRNWTVASAVAAFILATLGVALLAVIVAEVPIDLLMEVGALALLGLTTISALGWLVLQRQSALSDGASEFEDDPQSGEPAPAPAPPV